MVLLAIPAKAGADNSGVDLIRNGDFEQVRDGVPESWQLAGDAAVEQELISATGKVGRAAKLICSSFESRGASSHAMLAQVGEVGIERGGWYRISGFAKAEDIAAGVISVRIVNTEGWVPSGIDFSIPVGYEWRGFEKTIQARADTPASTSRIQFWYNSTGTLWLDEIRLERIEYEEKRLPEIVGAEARNPVPNASFECGHAGWGSYSPDIRYWEHWGANLYSLMGSVDSGRAAHGRSSLKIALERKTLPVLFFDYFEPAAKRLETILAAHHGWQSLVPGEQYVFSCFLMADREDTAVRIYRRYPESDQLSDPIKVGREWRRVELPFTAEAKQAWFAVGPDMDKTGREKATLWIDAVQVEKGRKATDFAVREALESFITPKVEGGVFEYTEGLSFRLIAYNSSTEPGRLRGRVSIEDFAGDEVFSRGINQGIRADSAWQEDFKGILRKRKGLFRVKWQPAVSGAYPQSLRCALIDSYRGKDSPFGMNHAYQYPWMLRRAARAGLNWWRDWSVKWLTVQESEDAPFDFSIPDAQIDRVIKEDGNLMILLPYPSAEWSSSADAEAVREAAGEETWKARTYTVACKPADEAQFEAYVAESLRHYRGRVSIFQIFNEPLYTHYALPEELGHDMGDYLRLLEKAHRAAKSADGTCQVLAGIGCGPTNHRVAEFVEKGGLKWTDILDLHTYPSASPHPARAYEEGYAALEKLMRERGEARPIWMTEFAVWANDDSCRQPAGTGDPFVDSRAYANEYEASIALVKHAAYMFSHGVRKIFFHAGVVGKINDNPHTGQFFRYGGAPTKMYCALSALSNLMGADFEPISIHVNDSGVRAYCFKVRGQGVAIVWSTGRPGSIELPKGVKALDLMGNELAGRTIEAGSRPLFLRGGLERVIAMWEKP